MDDVSLKADSTMPPEPVGVPPNASADDSALQGRIAALVEVNHELSKAPSVDELCRLAVELGCRRLGFDRLGLQLLSDDHAYWQNTYGMGEDGRVRDERSERRPLTDLGERAREMLANNNPLYRLRRPQTELRNHCRETVGVGTLAGAPLWNGERIVGFLNADDLFGHRGFTDQDMEILALYASALGHMVSRRSAEQTLRESEERFRALVEAAQDGVWSVDEHFHITFVSQPMGALLGYLPEELIGRRVMDLVFPEDVPEHERRLQARREGAADVYDLRLRCKDGSARWVRVAATPLRGVKGTFAGSFGMVTDITERRKADASRRVLQERLELALEVADLGLWDYDAATDTAANNDRYWTTLGYVPGELPATRETWFSLVHPDDRPRVEEAERAHSDGRSPIFEAEYRLRTKSGEWKWILDRGRIVERTATGKPLRAVGTHLDITSRKQSQEIDRRRLDELFAIFNSLDSVVYASDFQTHEILAVNEYAVQLYGRPLVGRKCYDVFQAGVGAPCSFCNNAALVSPDGLPASPVTWETFSHQTNRWFQCVARAIPWPDGRLVRLEVAADITERKETEAALLESEERHRRIIETANEGIWAMDGELRTTYVNHRMAELLGYSPEEMVGRVVTDFMFPEDLADHESRMQERRAGAPGAYERRFRRKDGAARWMLVSATAQQDAAGAFAGSFAMFTDVTDRKRAEEALKQSEARFRSYYELGLIGMAITSPDKGWLQCNNRLCEFLGYSREEMSRLTWAELTHPDDLAADVAFFNRVLAGEIDSYSVEKRYIRKDGRVVDAIISASAMRRPDRTIDHFVALVQDITDRKRAEAALRESEAKFRELAENIRNVFWIGSPDSSQVLYVSPAYAEVWGRSQESLLASPRSWLEAIVPEDRERMAEAVRLKTASAVDDPAFPDFRILRPDGTIRWIAARAYPIRDATGRVTRVVGIAEDITQRKQVEQTLREARERLEVALVGAGLGSWDVNLRTGHQTVDERWAAMLGYRLDELGPDFETWTFGVHPDDLPHVLAAVNAHLDGRTPTYETEHRLRTSAGDWTWVLARGRIVERDARGEPVRMAGTHLDISERKLAAEALAERDRRFRSLFTTMSEGVVIHELVYDDDGRVVNYRLLDVNPRFEAIVGIPRERAVNRLATEVYGVADPPFLSEFAGVAETRSSCEFETHFTPMNRDFHISVTSFQKGTFATIFSDITDRVRAEQERGQFETQLRQVAKMEAVGTMASGIAHDFNNLLTAIFGYAAVARRTLPPGHAAGQAIDMIEEAGRQASGVTNALLTFSRQSSISKAPVDLVPTVRESIRFLRRILPASIELVEELAPDQPLWIEADATQIQQVLMNLVVNARDAMPTGGRLRIAMRDLDETDEAADGRRWAVLVVEDDGFGMTPEVLARIYEPFFTTKRRGQGTGLGMSLIHGIVTDHGGRIDVDSEPGRGTRFTVRLPVCAAPDSAPAAAESASAGRGGGELILLAEDNDHVRTIIASSLRGGGYTVEAVSGGDDAVREYLARRDAVRLLVFDIDLPGQGGLEALRQIREHSPLVPAILITGGTDPDLELRCDDASKLLRKPFSMKTLLASVARSVAGETNERSWP